MSLVEDFKGGGGFGRIGEGTFPARIVQVIDLGLQENEYKGETSIKEMLWVTFELPTEQIVVDGAEKPRWLSSQFTKSTNEKSNLYRVVMAAHPEADTWKDLLGKPLLIEVGTTSGGKDKWTGATPLPKGMGVAELSNPPRYFDIEKPDLDLLNSLPDFLRDMITGSESFNKDGALVEKDVPF